MNDGRTYNMHQCEDVVPDAFPMVAHHGAVHHNEHLVAVVKNIIITIIISTIIMITIMSTMGPSITTRYLAIIVTITMFPVVITSIIIIASHQAKSIILLILIIILISIITSTQFSREAGGQTLVLRVDLRDRPLGVILSRQR